MQNENTKSLVISSLIWKYLERIGYQGIQFIVSIILARLLLPSDYGAIAMITVFIAISEVFIQSGFSSALIQQKDVDDLDFSSVFYAGLAISIVIYLILFFASPLIAKFYNMPIITSVLRVLALVLIIGSINSVQISKISREMKFKKLFLSNLGAVLFSGSIGILLAYLNYGVWALVAQQIVFNLMSTIILTFTSGWKPKLMFSFKRLKKLFSFGWKMLCSGLLDTVYRNIYNLVIGKKFNSETLGLYNKGEQIPKLVTVNIDGAISSVMLPAYSKEQENKDKLKKMVKRTISTSSYLLFPLMFGLVATAEPVILVLLTEKWGGAIPFLRLQALVYMLYPISTANLQAIKAVGRSDYYLKLEIIKKVFGIVVLFLTVPYGIYVMTIFHFITTFISTIMNAYPTKKLLNYGYLEQIKTVLPALLLSIAMFIPVYLLNYLNIKPILLLFIQIPLGGIIYISLSAIFKVDSFVYLFNTVKDFIKKKKVKK